MWKSTLLPAATGTVRDAIRIIDRAGAQICLVVDETERLLGTVTDGDIRRAILNAVSLDAPVAQVMKGKPVTAHPSDSPEGLLERMRVTWVRQIPLLDEHGTVVGLATFDALSRHDGERDNWVVLMAGGLGARLRPLTEDTPKPMLKVGNQPVLETILENFIAHGFRRFFISVNYKAEMVKDYFGDGSRWRCRIEYLDEATRMGTAGALSLLPERPVAPLVVMNGDVLTKVNLASLVEFHAEQRAQATMCVREYGFQVPYGVVEIDNHRIVGIAEKPEHVFFVNAGIYVLDPQVLSLLPAEGYFDMTDLFARTLADHRPTAAFPIREYWIDIGRLDDFERANGEYSKIFG
ncbi:MAG: nucleotidyltransferase family protein [Alphaproteobacteria bacterium]|nr:nucleotidyltransferase family protein [Alphaproteobacteria bacterium]